MYGGVPCIYTVLKSTTLCFGEGVMLGDCRLAPTLSISQSTVQDARWHHHLASSLNQYLESSIASNFKMALVGKKPYPKATVKKIIKAHSDLSIKKNADVAVCRDASYQKQQTSAHRYPGLSELCSFHGNVRHNHVVFFSLFFFA